LKKQKNIKKFFKTYCIFKKALYNRDKEGLFEEIFEKINIIKKIS